MDEFELDAEIVDAITDWLGNGLDDAGWRALTTLRDAVDERRAGQERAPYIPELRYYDPAYYDRFYREGDEPYPSLEEAYAEARAAMKAADSEPVVPIIEVLPHFNRAMLLNPDGCGWRLLVPLDNWSWGSRLRHERALIVDDLGNAYTATIAELRADRDFLIGPEAEVHCTDIVNSSDLPFLFDGDAWTHTSNDGEFGHGEWVMKINGDDSGIYLESTPLVFDSDEHAQAGIWLSMECDGESMTSGEIGYTVSVDDDGGLFVSEWSARTFFFGRATPDFGVDQLLGLLQPDGGDISGVVVLRSEVLGRDDMRRVLAWVSEHDVNPVEPTELEIECSGWSGTAADLLLG